ncbi:MAG: ABC transporter substrate-binding protein, partial [Oscillospiraceae bacterium]|nr:ABC transporter substrate-binding protein [Oscillospiraceae bacterium]
MKKIISLILAVMLMAACLSGCGNTAPAAAPAEAEMREFTDDLGRTVEIPVTVDKIAVSGPLTQVYVFPLCPELFAGFSNAFASDVEKYFPAEYVSLPEVGQLYGGKGTMDLEALLAAAPDVVIDVGEAKGNMAEDMEALTQQTGIPFVHIDANEETVANAYLRLGELTGKTEKAKELSDWCAENY